MAAARLSELIQAVRDGLMAAGLAQTEADAAVVGLVEAWAGDGYPAEHLDSLRWKAQSWAREKVTKRQQEAQAAQADTEAARQQREADLQAKLARAVVDAAFNARWQTEDPDGHRAAWRAYLSEKARNPGHVVGKQ